MEDFGLAYVFFAVINVAVLTVLPPLVANGVIVGPALALIAGFFACLFASRCLVGWFRQPANAFREGEAETIADQDLGDVLP